MRNTSTPTDGRSVCAREYRCGGSVYAKRFMSIKVCISESISVLQRVYQHGYSECRRSVVGPREHVIRGTGNTSHDNTRSSTERCTPLTHTLISDMQDTIRSGQETRGCYQRQEADNVNS